MRYWGTKAPCFVQIFDFHENSVVLRRRQWETATFVQANNKVLRSCILKPLDAHSNLFAFTAKRFLQETDFERRKQ